VGILIIYLENTIFFALHFLVIIIFILLSVAFFTVGERKLMAAIQRRKGPDVIGFWGLLQGLADGLKLLLKEIIFPYKSMKLLFFLGPLSLFCVSLLNWLTLPLNSLDVFTSLDVSFLFTFILAGLNIYGLVLAGWSGNSQYSFLGAVRSAAQMISYELLFSMVNLIIFLCAGSTSFVDILQAQEEIWFFFPLFPLFIIYLILILAETNRTPFDLAEAEAELVAGYNLEYSGIIFALFFLGEYANMLFLSILGSVLFLGGGFFFFESEFVFFLILKILFFAIFFVVVRATLPRYRYDQLMESCWRELFLLLFGFFFFYFGIFIFFDFGLEYEFSDYDAAAFFNYF
jgi:NADH-quinone oxidoreductase subunit H